MSQDQFQQDMMQLETFIETTSKNDSALIEVLHQTQHIFGYVPEEAMLRIGQLLNIPASKVFGVVSFYSFFTTTPKGKHVISVCMGTACFVRKADVLLRELEEKLGIKPGETTDDKQFTLQSLRCVGACGLAPVVLVDEEVHGKVDPEEIDSILEKYATA